MSEVLEEEVELETKTSKLNVFNWSMYDLANTIYSMIIVSLIINRYVLVIGQVEYGMEYGEASFVFGVVAAVMQVVTAIGMPIMGALSDTTGKRKPFVLVLTGIILLFASLLGLFHNIFIVLILYVIANIAYQWSLAFYDAMLPFIANPKDAGKVGGFGVAFGYLGTIISLLVMYPLIIVYGDVISKDPNPANLTYGYTGEWWVFVIPMALFLVFGIPLFFVKERQKKTKISEQKQILKKTFKQLGRTFKEIRKHRQMFIFVIGYFFIVDVANVIVAYMTPLVTDALQIEGAGISKDLFAIIFIIIATVSAVVFTYFIGKFAEKYGAKNAFFLVGGLWAVALILGILGIFVWAPITIGFNFPFIMMLVMGSSAGVALGGTWTAQRVMVMELAPKEKFGEYFGFSKLSGKVSSALGPLIFGAILLALDPVISFKAYGVAMAVVGGIMAIGLVIISFVRPDKSARNY
ncbi:MAG: MFS transporter [Candidatus Heimdallarchaeota archaeon]|nr:MFS transporter [Candidatus Heimdallarchaeota archaeon]MCK5142398.1 MFS transporter [Candidatus Heimdallarchaeota archaeon]